MASSANKWCKKLMTKDKANKLKLAKGSSGRFSRSDNVGVSLDQKILVKQHHAGGVRHEVTVIGSEKIALKARKQAANVSMTAAERSFFIPYTPTKKLTCK